jgi:hypothetical protein
MGSQPSGVEVVRKVGKANDIGETWSAEAGNVVLRFCRNLIAELNLDKGQVDVANPDIHNLQRTAAHDHRGVACLRDNSARKIRA